MFPVPKAYTGVDTTPHLFLTLNIYKVPAVYLSEGSNRLLSGRQREEKFLNRCSCRKITEHII